MPRWKYVLIAGATAILVSLIMLWVLDWYLATLWE